MAYVVKEDIIASIDTTINIVQGESNVYEITLDRDFIGNQLNAKKVSVISVGVLNGEGRKVLMYNVPVTPGVSDILEYAETGLGTPGVIRFEINEAQSRSLLPGDLLIQITLVFSDFYPNAKTYILPPLKIGQIIAGDPVDGGTDGGTGGGTDTDTSSNLFGAPLFNIEHINLDYPSSYGKMSVNSQDPATLTQIIFRNLDKNLVRSTVLENFVVNRMATDKIEGIITLYSVDNPNFFAMYKIISWERVDATSGNGLQDDTDAIKITVRLENVSTGPGVSKNIWEIGDSVTFAIDTYGITGNDIKPDGILTFSDKNKIVAVSTNGPKSPTGVYITNSPYYDSYVMIEINGISVELGNNVSTSTAYFSGNNGITPIEIESIRAGDQLIWNGHVAGFELEVGDEINFIYEVSVDDLR
jgi:hypothetical protein